MYLSYFSRYVYNVYIRVLLLSVLFYVSTRDRRLLQYATCIFLFYRIIHVIFHVSKMVPALKRGRTKYITGTDHVMSQVHWLWDGV